MRPAEGGIEIAAVIDGKYRLDSVIGRGGMGAVYRARHMQLGEDFAIKLLRHDMIHNRETVERFTREAQSAAKLKSEHVARVQDVGVWDGAPYMVMEHLHGADLGALVGQNGALYPGVAVDLVLQACDTLAEAHSLGIVHRDVKPSNLFVSFRSDETALVKVLDVGISKSAHAVDMSLTQTQSVLGTPASMSPEQMRSAKSVDPRSDIWSLGTVLYELVEGRLPFTAESFSEMCVMVAMDPPAPMQLGESLAPVIGRCLEKAPEDRFASIAELAAALVPHAQNPDAARYYVTRISRMLGVTRDSNNLGVPTCDSSPSIPLPMRLPIAALTMHGAISPAAQTLLTLNTTSDATRVEPLPVPGRNRLKWIGAIALVLVGSLTAVYAVTRSPKAEVLPPAAVIDQPPPPSVDPLPTPVTKGPAGNRITPPPPAPVVPPPQVSTPPKPRVTTKPKPAVTKPPVNVKPPVIAPPPVTEKPKTKCDPFESRTGCK